MTEQEMLRQQIAELEAKLAGRTAASGPEPGQNQGTLPTANTGLGGSAL